MLSRIEVKAYDDVARVVDWTRDTFADDTRLSADLGEAVEHRPPGVVVRDGVFDMQ